METTLFSSASTGQKPDSFRAISLTTLLSGTLVIVSTIINHYIESGEGPVAVFRYIASGAFGKETAAAGTLMIIWGVVLHYMIAFIFTFFLFVTYSAVIKKIGNKFLVGAVYGLFTWTIMYLVVVPLSKINSFPSDPAQALVAAVLLVIMAGLPVALVAHKYHSPGRDF